MIEIKDAPSDLTSINTEQGFGWTIADKLLSTVAFLLFFLAVISQWFFGFYTADYYDHTALQHRVELSNQQLMAHLNCPQKNSIIKQ